MGSIGLVGHGHQSHSVMAQSIAKKRRITPDLLAPTAEGPVPAAKPQLPRQPAFGELSVREQSRISEQMLGPGRRLFVDLRGGANASVSFRKVPCPELACTCTLPKGPNGTMRCVSVQLIKTQAVHLAKTKDAGADGKPSSSSGPPRSGQVGCSKCASLSLLLARACSLLPVCYLSSL